MDLLHTEFKRKFSCSLYKKLRLPLAEMEFSKDFITDTRGDLYPLLERTGNAAERVDGGEYHRTGGTLSRLFCAYFPYATYEVTAQVGAGGKVGFRFLLDGACATLSFSKTHLLYSADDGERAIPLPLWLGEEKTMLVSCRPSAFDIYFGRNGGAEYACTLSAPAFKDANLYERFASAKTALLTEGDSRVLCVCSFIDSGIGIADIRPIRYENGDVMVKEGRVYLTASLRMQEEAIQGVLSWVPGTSDFALTGAIASPLYESVTLRGIRLRKYITDAPTTSFTLLGESIVSEPIFEKRSTIVVRCVKSFCISSITLASTSCERRYSTHPSSDDMGVPNWWAVSLARPIHTWFCSSRLADWSAIYVNIKNMNTMSICT